MTLKYFIYVDGRRICEWPIRWLFVKRDIECARRRFAEERGISMAGVDLRKRKAAR